MGCKIIRLIQLKEFLGSLTPYLSSSVFSVISVAKISVAKKQKFLAPQLSKRDAFDSVNEPLFAEVEQ